MAFTKEGDEGGNRMNQDRSLDILKQAILLEKRGKAFYETAAAQTRNPAVSEFFKGMAEEESVHIRILSHQYTSYQEKGAFVPEPAEPVENHAAVSAVLTDAMQNQIASADFEAAAISAAMAMEERAIKLYSQRAKEASAPEEQALYRWLAQWETGHLETLAVLDRELTEKVWNDASFWPF